MKTIPGKFAILNEKLLAVKQFQEELKNLEFHLYEVLRIVEGVPLFVEDHLERLNQGAQSLNIPLITSIKEISIAIKKLIQANQVETGNVRILANPGAKYTSLAVHLVPHYYPADSFYISGIALATYAIQRPNPNLKQLTVSNNIANAIKELRDRTGAYEILLIDEIGNIREGSKSNFFLVKDNILFSAPGNQILLGITRKKIVELAKKTGIALIEKELPLSEISFYDAAFICGTSPKLLPLNSINSKVFNPNHATITSLRMEYDQLIANYVRQAKKR